MGNFRVDCRTRIVADASQWAYVQFLPKNKEGPGGLSHMHLET